VSGWEAEMTKYRVGTREEWLAARTELLEREKELTRRSDELARRRQTFPWVAVEKGYMFETGEGTKTLAVGLSSGKRFQSRLRSVHGGGAKNRHRLQLRYAEACG
jgi:predicted dithiol-disulfide oxidoreductase (DUF899 family)